MGKAAEEFDATADLQLNAPNDVWVLTPPDPSPLPAKTAEEPSVNSSEQAEESPENSSHEREREVRFSMA